jgi:hypothetical protein
MNRGPDDNPEPEAGIGLFAGWREEAKREELPEAGIGLFSGLESEPTSEPAPDAGIGLFRHYSDGE